MSSPFGSFRLIGLPFVYAYLFQLTGLVGFALDELGSTVLNLP